MVVVVLVVRAVVGAKLIKPRQSLVYTLYSRAKPREELVIIHAGKPATVTDTN